MRACPNARRFYDINLRTACFNRETVTELLSWATVVKLNDIETEILTSLIGMPDHSSLEDFCLDLSSRFALEAVCVTRGDKGCALLSGDHYVDSPAYPARVADTIGAGDAFAAALVHSLSLGWNAARCADFANRLGSIVASRAGAIPYWSMDELDQVG